MPESRTSLITFLSDYGLEDGFVGVCHGVMARIAPQARIIDIAHGVSAYQIPPAALLLKRSLSYFAVGVHVAVVDPGVGQRSRRAVALVCNDGRVMVGPDNGLLMPAARACDGVLEAVEISESPYRLENVSATFHGRDIFCPVAAHLANGLELSDAGQSIDPSTLVELETAEPVIGAREIEAQVIGIDRFGNIALNVTNSDLGDTFSAGENLEIEAAGRSWSAVSGSTFADVQKGSFVVYEDSYGFITIAINHGIASLEIDVSPGDEVKLSRR